MNSLRGRLTISVAASLIPIVAALSVLIYLAVEQRLRQQVDDGLVATATAFASVIELDPEEPSGYEFEFDASLAPEFADEANSAYFEIWMPNGEIRGKSKSLGTRDLPRLEGTLHEPALEPVELPGGRPGRMVYYEFWPRIDSEYTERDPGGQVALALARDTTELERTLAIIAGWLWGLGGLAVVLAGGAVFLSVRRGLRPLERFARAIEAIDDASLASRIQLRGYPIELRVPVAKLNDLLERLGEAFSRERRLTADLSHELRTPLAALRTVLEVAASRERTTAEYRKALADAEGIVKGMITTAENLLIIAQADAGQAEITTEAFDLHALVEECWAPYMEVARERSLEFRNDVLQADVIESDREKLRIVLSNLLSNAAAYTELGGWIAVTSPGPETIVLRVADSGPPIPREDLERIFDRFWRGDSARTAAGTHAGIGLSLARSLCHCLDYAVAAANTPEGGASFTISKSSG